MHHAGGRLHPGHVVLDQNVLRDRQIMDRLQQTASAGGPRLLLSDAVLLEMTKGERWHDSVTRSLALLARRPELVDSAFSVSELMRQEHRTGEGIQTVTDEVLSADFQQILREASSCEGEAWQTFLSRIPDAREQAKRTHLDPGTHRQLVSGLVETLMDSLSAGAVQQLRSRPTDDALRLWILADRRLTSVIRSSLAEKGFPNAEGLARSDSLSARTLLSRFAAALDWIAFGGLESQKSEEFVNDYWDDEAVLIATYAGGLASKEKDVMRHYELLRVAIAARVFGQDVLSQKFEGIWRE